LTGAVLLSGPFPRAERARGNLIEKGALHPRPARSSEGMLPLQMFGDVWEWTASAYLPYPRYAPAKGALGEYNGKLMSNQMVLRGCSCSATTFERRPFHELGLL